MSKAYLIQGNSSLFVTTTISNEAYNCMNHAWTPSQIGSFWYERDFKKGADYRHGPVTVINFDYLENN